MLSEPLTLYKLMILFMLKQSRLSLSNAQFSEFFLDKEYTSYFTLQQALSELAESSLIATEVIRNTTRYQITREGEEALSFFLTEIPEAIVKDMDEYLRNNRIKIRNEVSVVADYYPSTSQDWIAQCEVREGNGILYRVEISVPTEKQAETICRNWDDHCQEIYMHVMRSLLGEEE